MKNIFVLYFLLLSFILASCGTDEALKQEYLDAGIWRGVIKTQGQELPFNFEVVREDSVTYHVYIINGKERIEIRGLAMQGDSVFIPMHLFDSGIKAKLVGNKLIGIFSKHYEENSSLPFEATYNKAYRFTQSSKKSNTSDVSGKWEVRFMDGNNVVDAVGIFTQEGNNVEGTFITSKGDFRYLEGSIENDKTLWLSTFDGENAFLFKADILENNELKGHFWSGPFDYMSWTAKKNVNATIREIPSESLLTGTNKQLNFKLTDLNGKMVSLSDQKYKDKIKVIQLFGTWSSNCLDEVRFLSEWHKQNRGLDVVVLGLAFEQKDDFTYAKSRINKMANRLNAQYEFLVAGSADKSKAALNFDIIHSIEAFPTTLILDKDNVVRYLNTGFTGPACGTYYEEHKNTFHIRILTLLEEKNLSTSLQELTLVKK